MTTRIGRFATAAFGGLVARAAAGSRPVMSSDQVPRPNDWSVRRRLIISWTVLALAVLTAAVLTAAALIAAAG
jgi:hypothetical protein